MNMIRRFTAIAGAAALLTSLSPMPAHAAVFPMRHTKIELNSGLLSSPSGFTYHNTTYMPLYYVSQLLNKLQVQNTWDGTTWSISTPFLNQPTFTLKTLSGSMDILVNDQSFADHVDKVVTTDPSSGQNTTFIPIWYIMQTLKSLGLESQWNGSTWNVTSDYTAFSKTGKRLGAFTKISDAENALLDYPGGMVKDGQGNVVFTEASFKNVDLRYPAPSDINASSLNRYLANHDSIMSGLGDVFMQAQATYGVNANYLVSHALEETGSDGNVSAMAEEKNNLYGYGAFDANATAAAGTFPSEAYAILFQAWEVRNNYLNPGSSHYNTPTLNGMAQNYASDPNWANKVNNLMDQLAIDMNDNVTSYTQYSQSNDPTVPTNSTAIPVYHISGATGTVNADPYYGANVPVYSDGGAGHKHMFVRELKLGEQGNDVETLQKALNSAEGAGLTTDGLFGAKTQSALMQYQTAHGLSATGVCDFDLWNRVLGLTDSVGTVEATQTIHIDGIVEGMAGGHVTEWYHVPTVGWVNADDVTLTNVYKLTVPGMQTIGQASIAVTDASGNPLGTLHVGDYVVSQNPTPVNNQIQLQYVNQSTSSSSIGYVNATNVQLTQVSR